MDGIALWLPVGLLAGGVLAGAGFFYLHLRLKARLAESRSRAAMLDAQIAERDSSIDALNDELHEIDSQRERSVIENTSLREKIAGRDEQIESLRQNTETVEKRMRDAIGELSAGALARNNKQFIELAEQRFTTLLAEFKGEDEKTRQSVESMIKPIRELMDRQNVKLAELDKRWTGEKSGIEEKLRLIADAHNQLSGETGRLVKALKRPEQRGRWGEVQLQNVVELAGMAEHCDFSTQPTTDDPDTRDRPDMVVNLPGGGVIVVDSKVALDAYLDAAESDDESARLSAIARHVQQVESHIRKLAKKSYWEQFDRTPKLVVMFVPVESALMAALQQKPHLHAEAMENHVLIATPTLLVALLRAVAYGWQQEAVARNAREIAVAGRALYGRLNKFVNDIDALGQKLSQATRSYNAAVGSFQGRVLPSARRLKDLGASTIDDIESPPQVELEVRPIITEGLRSASNDAVEEGLYTQRDT